MRNVTTGVIFFMILVAHMGILFIVKVKICLFLKRSCSPPNYVDC